MKKILKLIFNNMKNIVSIKTLIIIVAIFASIFTYKKENLSKYIYLDEYIRYIFYGPKDLVRNIPELFIWSLHQFVFLAIAAKYIGEEFKIKSIYFISRIGSKFKWYLSLKGTLLSLSFVYYIIVFCEVYIFSIPINVSISISSIHNIIFMFFILSLTSYLYINSYILILIKNKKKNNTLLCIIVLIYFCIYLGSFLGIDVYVPFTQGIFAKHLNTYNSYMFSISYLFLLNILIDIYTFTKILSKDVTNILE